MASVLLLLPFLGPTVALVRPDGIGRLPALGWNSWNAFGCNINASAVISAAESLVSLGLKDAGYEYVNIDDCWSVMSGRDNVTQQIIPDPVKFPDGISGLAEQVHALGLKVGIYSSAGTQTCAGYPASIGFEDVDAASFAAWGIEPIYKQLDLASLDEKLTFPMADYLKYDNCNIPDNWTDTCDYCTYHIASPENFVNGTCVDTSGICPAGYNYTASNTAQRYQVMRDALLAQNRTILYSLCDWGYAGVTEWGNSTGNSWRVTLDIRAKFSYILSIINQNSFLMDAVDFWGHNDADMLEIGNGLSTVESRTHFAFWAAMKSPLILGTTLSKLSQADLDIVLNKALLAFHQDPIYGAAAKPYKWGTNPDWTFNATNPAEYWSGQTSQGILVLMMNSLSTDRSMTAEFAEIPGLGGGKRRRIIDAWTGDYLGCFSSDFTVEVASHDTAVILIQGECCHS